MVGQGERGRPPSKGSGRGGGSGLPSLDVRSFLPAERGRSPRPPHDGSLPNATLIYGIAAAVFFVISAFSFLRGAWVTGLILWLPVAGFLGLAFHFLRHPDR